MLNWRTYLTLNNTQKEEYVFRFKHKEDFYINNLLMNIILFFMVIIISLFIIYLSVTSPELAQYKNNIFDLMKGMERIIFIIDVLILGYIIEFVVRSIVKFKAYYTWKKENNIKQLY